MSIALFAFSLALLLLLGFSYSIAFDVPIGHALPTAAMSMTLWVYALCALMGRLSAGVISLVPVVLGFVIIVVLRNRSAIRVRLKERCCTWGLAGFVLFAAICVLAARMHGENPLFWDEFAHWGQMTQQLISLDGFYTLGESTLNFHNDYPPIVPLWEALCCVIPVWQFKGKVMYASLWLLQGLMLLPLVELMNGSSAPGKVGRGLASLALVLAFSLVCVPAFDGGAPAFWKSIYPDALLGLVAGFALWQSIRFDFSRWSTFSLAVTLSFLILVKQAALVFAFACAVTVLVRALRPGHSARKGRPGSGLLAFLAAVAPCVVTWASWRLVCAGSPLAAATNGQFSAGDGVLGLSASAVTDMSSFATKYLYALLVSPVSSCPLPPASCFGYLAFCVGAVAIIGVMADKRSLASRVCVAQVVLWALYAVFMYVMYIGGGFSASETARLASFERYMGTCLTTIMYVTVAFLARYYDAGFETHRRVATVCAACLVIACCWVAPNGLRDVWGTESQAMSYSDQNRDALQDARLLLRSVPAGSKVFVVDEGRADLQGYALRVAYFGSQFFEVDRASGRSYSSAEAGYIVDSDVLRQWLSDDDVLYCRRADEGFNDRYSEVLGAKLESGCVYEISLTNEGIDLKKI